MLTRSGVKLLDFGLAKFGPQCIGWDCGADGRRDDSAPLTGQGTILGTLQYMAPEQLEGREADSRTDIFAFGALLYEMATGKRAFRGESHASLISSIMATEPPPVSSLAPMAPPALDRVVRRCLAKDPDGRWQSARDVALELDEIARAPVTATAAGPGPRRRDFAGWIVAAGLLLALLAALFGPWRRAPSAPAAPVRFTVSPPRDTAFQGMLALSPDGRRLAFVATTADGRDLLWTRALDSLESRALEGTDGANYPFWSPDGRFLAFFAGGKLKKIEATGGSPQTLCDAAAPRGGSWGSTGTIVFAANAGGQIERVAEAGGQATPLPHLTSKRDGDFFFRWPSFLPDGNRFLYFTFAADTGRAGLSVASLDSPDTTWVTASDSGAAYVSSGFLFYRVGDRLMSQAFDAGQLRVTGEPVPFVEDVWWDGISTLATAFSTSSGGIVAYQTGGLSSTRLLWHDRSGKELGSVGPPGAYFEPALSPDGRWLAVARADAGGARRRGSGGLDDRSRAREHVALLSRLTFRRGDASLEPRRPPHRLRRLSVGRGLRPRCARGREGEVAVQGRGVYTARRLVTGRAVPALRRVRLADVPLRRRGARSRGRDGPSGALGDIQRVRGAPLARRTVARLRCGRVGKAGSLRPELSGGGLSPADLLGRRHPAALARRRSRALLHFGRSEGHERGCPSRRGARDRGAASAVSNPDPPDRRSPEPLRRLRGRPAFPRELAPSRRCVASDQRRRRLVAGEAQVSVRP